MSSEKGSNEFDQIGDIAEQLEQTESDSDDEENQGEGAAGSRTTPTAESERENQSKGGATGSRPSDSDGPTRSSKGSETGDSPQTDQDTSREPADTPAFSFDQTEMHGFYVREETWAQVAQMQSSVAAACSMFDVNNFEGREFQDACLRVLAEHGDEVALQILRERGVDADEDRIEEVIEMLGG